MTEIISFLVLACFQPDLATSIFFSRPTPTPRSGWTGAATGGGGVLLLCGLQLRVWPREARPRRVPGRGGALRRAPEPGAARGRRRAPRPAGGSCFPLRVTATGFWARFTGVTIINHPEPITLANSQTLSYLASPSLQGQINHACKGQFH